MQVQIALFHHMFVGDSMILLWLYPIYYIFAIRGCLPMLQKLIRIGE